ncbi:hypothetical protein TL16_g01987 [Triparma laevis f. inornata]|uniref:Uncharacterized protein n=1 Tax=Triparma laevis f. inornata TaxID=1714386 RepID=A0A9W7DYX0_9STRA|nr:hypothetical protein TL16_g01987 [Triparma laevis f. inornata]
MHPVSRFISHRLFGQGRGVWLGKEIRDNGSAGPNKVSWELGQEIHAGGSNGNNVFVESDGIQTFLGTTTRFRDFKVERCPSKLDKQPCVALDYNIGGKHSRSSCVWRGMRDELRMLQPGYYIGCGSMKVFGGMPNFTLFTLKKRTNKF